MLILGILMISIGTAGLPVIISSLAKKHSRLNIEKANNWLPSLAGLLFFTAWFLPDIHISSATTTFQQHFIGGGMYGALLYIYFKQIFGWYLGVVVDWLVLFAWVSSLGVANELLEFVLNSLGLGHIATGDTDWDLLANTCGALICYFIYIIVGKVAKYVR